MLLDIDQYYGTGLKNLKVPANECFIICPMNYITYLYTALIYLSYVVIKYFC